MYGRGIQELLEALPSLSELDNEQAVRRLLSRAWLDLAETRELGVANEPNVELAIELRRLALALQVHSFLVPAVSDETIRAAAFVAAEALDIAGNFELQGPPPQERVVVGLLYLIAGYDANAAVTVLGVSLPDDIEPSHGYALSALKALLTSDAVPAAPAPADHYLLHDRVRALLWREIGQRVGAFVTWLRDPRVDGGDDRDQLLALAAALKPREDAGLSFGNGDIEHVLELVIRAVDAAAGRALRDVAPPPESVDGFTDFLVARCRVQPLLWPAAATYAREALPGPNHSAVVAVPTGAGKSAVADLAIQHASPTGWVLYLAPTNALVSQIRRQLRADHPGVTIREFFGGVEYTTLDGETLQNLTPAQVFVMTPEKCSLALRQSPEAFATMSLCVLDEAHILADDHGRGQLTELVLSEVLTRAPNGHVLLMSALIANPDALAEWLETSHGKATVVVREPWRPTRTLRAVVGVEEEALQTAAAPAVERLADLPARRRNVAFNAPLAALAGLYGPWSTDNEDDYALVDVATTIPVNVTRPSGGGDIAIDIRALTVRPAVEALAQLLGERGQRVMAFLPRFAIYYSDSFQVLRRSLTSVIAIRLPSPISVLTTMRMNYRAECSTALGLSISSASTTNLIGSLKGFQLWQPQPCRTQTCRCGHRKRRDEQRSHSQLRRSSPPTYEPRISSPSHPERCKTGRASSLMPCLHSRRLRSTCFLPATLSRPPSSRTLPRKTATSAANRLTRCAPA